MEERPSEVQLQSYAPTPLYYQHRAYEDKLAILVCQIKIWEPEDKQWFDVPKAENCLTIRECESVEISNSCKDLLNKAVVRFPRGTVVSLCAPPEKPVNTGDKADDTQGTAGVKEATNSGEYLTPGTSTYADDGISTTPMAMNYDDKGLIDFNRTTKEPALLSPNNLATGDRIEIRLGYAYSEEEYKRLTAADSPPELVLAFTGFITSISATTPLEIECTNMAHILASVSTPDIPAQGVLTVKDFLDDNGKYKLLNGAGIQLAESCKRCEIFVSGAAISHNLTVADVLTEWAKSGILCMIKTDQKGNAYLHVGMGYMVGSGGGEMPNTDKRYITYNGGGNQLTIIQFDWDVAQDKLGMKHCDKKYIAIEAQGLYVDTVKSEKVTKFMKLTLRPNPNMEGEGTIEEEGGEFQTVKFKEYATSRIKRHRNGTMTKARVPGKLKDNVSMDKYTVVKYYSPTPNVTKEQLIEEAKQYWARYSPNGISGSIEIFGDVVVHPTDIVGLVDMRQPEKNGYYFVESVTTTFGSGGYRRELKLPHKIASFANPVQIIR